jgi:hypothetical protein
MRDVCKRRFWVWRARHPHEAEDPEAVWAAAWAAGGWDAMLRSTRLGELVPRMEELIDVFRTAEIEREIEPSFYWRSDRQP